MPWSQPPSMVSIFRGFEGFGKLAMYEKDWFKRGVWKWEIRRTRLGEGMRRELEI